MLGMRNITDPVALAAWLAIALFVVVYDLWALLTGHRTLSAQFHRWFRAYGWFRVLSVALLLILILHLFVEPIFQ